MTTTAPAAPSPSSHLDRRVLTVAGVVVLGSIMSILDITVVSVALRTFMDEFDASYAQVAWVATAYTLALATVIPLTGWASDRFGTKYLYLTAVALFAIGSALCSTADSLGLLVTYRVLQGIGGGMLMPLGMTMLTKAAGPERVGRVMSILGIPMLLGPICGPILGGWLIDIASWHWIFLINVPLGVVTIIYGLVTLDRDQPHRSESFDLIGMLLLSPGLALFLYGVSSIPQAKNNASDADFTGNPWLTVTWTLIVGGLLCVAFVFWALRKANKHPLVDLRLFRDRNMTVSVLSLVVFCAAFFGASLLFPSYYQQIRAEEPMWSGILMAPQGLGAMVAMPIAGILADKLGPRKVVIPGLALIVVGMAMFSTLDAHTSYWFLSTSLVVMGLGMGSAMMPLFSSAMATLTHQLVARGSTLVNIVQQIAASIGTAIFAVLLTQSIASHVTDAGSPAVDTTPYAEAAAHGFSSSFWVATVMCVLILVPAFFLPNKPIAAQTPVH